MSIIDSLVMDRTVQDITDGTAKGHYNASDLNRVGRAMKDIALRLSEYGYAVSVGPKTDWSVSDIPTQSQMRKYLDDLAALRAVIDLPSSTPNTPTDMHGLTWQEANDIERILYDVDRLFTNVVAAWYYSGDLVAGEV